MLPRPAQGRVKLLMMATERMVVVPRKADAQLCWIFALCGGRTLATKISIVNRPTFLLLRKVYSRFKSTSLRLFNVLHRAQVTVAQVSMHIPVS